MKSRLNSQQWHLDVITAHAFVSLVDFLRQKGLFEEANALVLLGPQRWAEDLAQSRRCIVCRGFGAVGDQECARCEGTGKEPPVP